MRSGIGVALFLLPVVMPPVLASFFESETGTALRWAAAPAAAPAGIGVAILRHRLYDIDRIVSRTIGYALLSGVLVSVYVAGVVLSSAVLEPASGGSDVAVAVGTLAAAAVFQPLRRRIQHAVDRRFNRRRYDAARTIDAFSTQLRHEVDLDSLRSDLMDVVTRTLEPAGVSLWLRTPKAPQ